MSRASALARGRAAAKLGMVDACTIRRRGADTTDDNSGQVTQTRTTLYTGKCRIQQQTVQGAAATPQTPGQDYQLLVGIEVQLPVVGTEDLAVGDEITITAAARDADLVGLVLIVRELVAKTDATSRRIGATRRTS